MKSIVKEIGPVTFPAHTMERAYMREFRKETGVPYDLKRWQPTIDQMLAEVDTDGPIYLMIDQGFVKANQSHRRPGIHIDGYWIPELQTHSGGGGHIHNASGDWRTIPTWLGPRLVPGCAEDLRDMKFWTYKAIEEDNK